MADQPTRPSRPSKGIVIDSHNDSLVAHLRRGCLPLSAAAEEPVGSHTIPGTVQTLRDEIPRSEPVQLNVELMRAGGIDAAFFAVDVTRARHNHLAYALDAYGYLDAEIERLGGDLQIARTASDIRKNHAEGRLSAVLVLENSDGLEKSLNVLRMLYRVGLRVIGFTHNPRSEAADGVAEEGSGGGLTSFGRALVRDMNALGMLIDVAHLSSRGIWDVLELSEKPVIDSHTCCRALCDHPRNLTDEQMRAIAQAGGVIGITFVPSFLKPEGAGLDDAIRHIEHAVALVGVDHVGIGSDFDGGGDAVKDAAEFPKIAQALLDRGFSEEDVAKIMGENHLRLFEQVCG